MCNCHLATREPTVSHRFLVTGASGQLGAYVIRELMRGGREVVAWSGTRVETVQGVAVRPVELSNRDLVAQAFRDAAPTAVIHAAAMAAVGDCARDPVRADAVNHQGTAMLAELAANSRARFVFVSTDLVFDGVHAPYREDAAPAPLSAYGRTKAHAEQALDCVRQSRCRSGESDVRPIPQWLGQFFRQPGVGLAQVDQSNCSTTNGGRRSAWRQPRTP